MPNIPLINYSDKSSRDEYIKNFMDEIDPLDNTTEIIYSASDVSKYRVSKDALTGIENLYQEFNAKYGLELKFDASNIIQQFGNILEPHSLRIFEIYLSETYSRLRLILYQKIMIHVITLLDEITSIKNNEDVPVQDKYIMTEKLLEFMSTINRIYDEIKIENPEIELKRIRDEINDDSQSIDYSDPEVREVMKKLRSTTLKQSEDAKLNKEG